MPKALPSKVTIRRAAPRDEKRWRELFDGYCLFYERTPSEPLTRHTLERIMDDVSPFLRTHETCDERNPSHGDSERSNQASGSTSTDAETKQTLVVRQELFAPLTFDVRGGGKWTKPACGRPLDESVRPRVRGKPLRCCARPDQ